MPHLDGPDLFYDVHGSGLPVLTMHGIGLDHTYFRPWLDGLGEAMEVVYYDHRGNGRSGRPRDWSRIDHDVWVDDADRLREELGYEAVVLLGHSYGGYLALEYALRHGDRLDALILCSTAPAMDYPEVVMENLRKRGSPEQEELLTGAFGGEVRSDEGVREAWRALLPLYFREYDPAVGRALLRRTEFSGGALHRAFVECLPDFDVTGRLDEIAVPTLVLVGRHDWITPPEQGSERLHRGLRDSDLVVFEESGHFPFVEEQEGFVSTVRQWVAGIRGEG